MSNDINRTWLRRFFYVFIIKTVGKGHGLTLRHLFLIRVWRIKQKRRAWLRWLYNLLGGSNRKNDICKSGYRIVFVFVRTVYDPVLRISIKTHNFVTFYEFLIHLGVHHTGYQIRCTHFVCHILEGGWLLALPKVDWDKVCPGRLRVCPWTVFSFIHLGCCPMICQRWDEV